MASLGITPVDPNFLVMEYYVNPARPDLTPQEFEGMLSGAFLPYSCTFTAIEQGNGFSFAVRDGEAGLLEVSYGGHKRISDKLARSAIAQARKYLRSSGRKLLPWKFPDRAGGGTA